MNDLCRKNDKNDVAGKNVGSPTVHQTQKPNRDSKANQR